MCWYNRAIPPAILRLIEKPSLYRGESRQEYYEFFHSVVETMQPEDMIDWMWTLRWVDESKQGLRLRRFRVLLVDARYKYALFTVIVKAKLPVGLGVSAGEYDRRRVEAEAAIRNGWDDPASSWPTGSIPIWSRPRLWCSWPTCWKGSIE